MKKNILICVSLLILFLLPGCQSDNSEDLSLKLEALEKENNLLKSELKEMTKERDKLKAEKEELEKSTNEISEEEVLIEVVDKINMPKDIDKWILDDRVNFHISIRNNSKKDIREIEGVLDVRNESAISILRMDCNLGGHIIKAGEKFVNKDTFLKINEYKNEDTRLYKADHADLNYTYTIKKIIYTDGTSEM